MNTTLLSANSYSDLKFYPSIEATNLIELYLFATLVNDLKCSLSLESNIPNTK
jgi:hypothetical protein